MVNSEILHGTSHSGSPTESDLWNPKFLARKSKDPSGTHQVPENLSTHQVHNLRKI